MSLMLGTRKALLYGTERGRVPEWAVGMDMWSDFTRQEGMGVNDNHAQTIYAPNASGVYLPFGSNEKVRTDLGLQTVPTRQNLLTFSTDYSNGAWAKANSTVVVDVFAAPDGTMTADAVYETASTANKEISRSTNVNIVAGNQYTYSVFIKANGRNRVKLQFQSTPAFQTGTVVYANLTGSGSLDGIGAGVNASSITAFANDWYLVSITGTAQSTMSSSALFLTFVESGTTTNHTGDPTKGVALWNANMEIGAFATPPMVTTGSALTVNGNQQVITGLGASLVNGVAGFVQVNQLVLEADRPLIAFTNGTVNERFVLTTASGGTQFRMFQSKAGSTSDVAAVTSGRSLGVATIAYVIANGYANYRVVGSTQPAQGTQLPVLPTLTELAFGGVGYNNAANAYQYARKVALNFLAPQEDPVVAFNDAFAKAQLAAAA